MRMIAVGRAPPYEIADLIYCVPGLVLGNFEWAEVVLDFNSEGSAGAGSAVALSVT